ncbi:MAG: 3-keto-disaccharide hydrolase [Thermoguttaceae bacterium]
MKRFVLAGVVVAALAFPMFSVAATLGFGPSGTQWSKNGQPQFGWVKRGGDATFVSEGNEVIGRRGEGANTFLCTERNYENFVLSLECKFDVACNSGIQFRSNARKEGDREVVYGYQCELDQSNMTCAIYDESRRNRWVDPLTPEKQSLCVSAFKKDGWNKIVIQCVGPSIKTWLNGEMITDLVDIEESRGFIALQVHSGDQGVVRWRNIQIDELPATPWIPLFAGKIDEKMIEIKPVGKWKVEDDGSLNGTTEPGEPRDGMVLSRDVYDNFAVKVSYKMTAGNSGLYFRATEIDKPYWLKGFQCEIAGGEPDAGLWEVEGRGWVGNDKKNPKTAEFVRAGEWNTVGTVATGDHLVTFLNGNEIVNIIDEPCAKNGKTGLQLHGGGSQGCSFKDYFIMPLSPEVVKLMERKDVPVR